MMKLARYPNLRPTDIIGHDKIPAHWDVRKVARAFDLIGSGTTPNTNLGDYYDGDINWVTTAELRETVIEDTQKKVTERALREHSALRTYSVGSVAIAMYGATIGRLGILGSPATVNQACCVFDRSSVLNNRYFYYWLWSYRPVLLSLSSGGGQPNLSQDDLRSIRVPVPSPSEQLAIVDFLDRETARIDALIEKKRRLLELLEEKRLAVITHAVTKGLDPSAPVKDSGIDWLGQIPAHWEVKRLHHLNEPSRPIMYGIVLPGPHVDDGVPIIKGGDVRPEKMKWALLNRTTYELDESHAKSRVRGGDLVYAIRGSFGDVELVPDELTGANLTQDAARIAPLDSVDRDWLMFALKSEPVRQQLDARSLGATIKGVNIRDLKRAVLAVPPTDEQSAIAGHLGAVAKKFARLYGAVASHIEKLVEFRSALITNAVTGKIDVREAAQKEAAE